MPESHPRSAGRLLVVVNPKASRAESLQAAVGALFNHGFEVDLRRSTDRGGLAALIEAEGASADAVVIGGGDGTVNSAVAALVGGRHTMGILPLGTANDLALTLGIPADPVAAAGVIAAGHRRRIDVGRVNDATFLNVASIGLSVSIAERQDEDLKKRWRVLSYVIAAANALGDAERFRAVITCDDASERVHAYQIAIGNGVHYGGGLKIADDAAIDDGFLDVCAIETRTVADLIAAAPGLADGSIGQRNDVRMMRGRKVRIETETTMPINTDGEITTQTPAVLSVTPGALEVLVPAETAG